CSQRFDSPRPRSKCAKRAGLQERARLHPRALLVRLQSRGLTRASEPPEMARAVGRRVPRQAPRYRLAATDEAQRPACLTQLQLPEGTPITGTVDSDLAWRINESSRVPPGRRKLTTEIEARGDGELF